jgi:benzil reductase ((S)-benzoin forming)
MGDHLGELLKDVPVLDLAILNAGVLGTIQDLRDTSLDALRAVMDTNVWANKIIIDYLMARHTVRQLIAVSSGSAVNGSAGWGAYSISKAALNLLVRVYAHEHPDTHVTAFAPGLVDTDMIYPVLHGDDPPDYEAVRRIRASGDAGRVMSPGTAAEATLDALPKLLETETGAYVDIRNL